MSGLGLASNDSVAPRMACTKPKGDADLLRRVYAEARRAGRARDFYLFHLGHPQLSARYNAIGSFSRVTELATRIANQLPSEGNSAAFKEFAWRFVNIIARALVALGRRPDYQQVRRYINDIEPLFMEYAREHLRRHGKADWAGEVAEIADKISERNLAAALELRQDLLRQDRQLRGPAHRRSSPPPRPGRTWRHASATVPRQGRWPATSTP